MNKNKNSKYKKENEIEKRKLDLKTKIEIENENQFCNYKIKYDKPFNTNNDDKYYLNYWGLVDDFRDFYI